MKWYWGAVSFGERRSICVCFPAISNAAKISIRHAIRKIVKPLWTNEVLEVFAKVLNAKIMGWIIYYGKFFKLCMIRIFEYLYGLIRRWIAKKYKITAKGETLKRFKRL